MSLYVVLFSVINNIYSLLCKNTTYTIFLTPSVASKTEEKINSQTAVEESRTVTVDSPTDNIEFTAQSPSAPNTCCIVSHVYIEYNNQLLNHGNLLQESFALGGIEATNRIIALGKEDIDVSNQIIAAEELLGPKKVAQILFEQPKNSGSSAIDSISAGKSQLPLICEAQSSKVQLPDTEYIAPNLGSSNTYKLSIFNSNILKHYIYRNDISHFNKILEANNIENNVNDLLSNPSFFKRQVLLKLHPDKGGKAEDFNFAMKLQEKYNSDLDAQELLNDAIKEIQPILHQASLGFKIIDSIVDSARLALDPTYAHASKVIIDSTLVYSMYTGFNSYSTSISGLNIAYNLYQEEYKEALTQATTTISFMSLPYMLEATGVPYISLAYGVGMTAYTGYNAMSNVYSFYEEYIAEASNKTINIKEESFFQNIYEHLINQFSSNDLPELSGIVNKNHNPYQDQEADITEL